MTQGHRRNYTTLTDATHAFVNAGQFKRIGNAQGRQRFFVCEILGQQHKPLQMRRKWLRQPLQGRAGQGFDLDQRRR